MTALDCQILTDEKDVEALAGEWRQLFTRTGRSPFSDYDLFIIWWRTIGKTSGARGLHVVIGRTAGQLMAVLPLVVIRRHGLRMLQAAGYKGYNYCDMLAETPQQAAALWQAARQSPHYHFASIRDVYPGSMCYDALEPFARQRDLSEALYLDVKWKSGEEWLASLSKKARQEYKRHMRRLEEKGPVQFEVYKDGPLPMDIVDAMIKQKITWANERDKQGLFEHQNVHLYFAELLATAAREGRLFFAWLKCGSEIIAYMLGLTYDGVLHSYVLTYNPSWSACAPGILVMINSVSWAIDNGFRGVDYRQGDAHYKARYANETRMCAEFTFSGSVFGRLMEKAFMALRKLLRVLRIRTF